MQRGRFLKCVGFSKIIYITSGNRVFAVWIRQVFQNQLHIKKEE